MRKFNEADEYTDEELLIMDSPDDMPDGYFDDDVEYDIDIEDPAYWDDANEIDYDTVIDVEDERPSYFDDDEELFIESKKRHAKSRMKEDTSAFMVSPKGAEEKEIPAWVMKAFHESKGSPARFKKICESYLNK